ncbi:hypothetical protein SAMN05660350_03715 [Geodermatophilus obscurus]|uniref:Uncharacterized protein n=1 Tax=Geodermatophilus obscurus TaxID=1861 RepID=A0A1M7UQJ1_9ACTN|nr:hypothetical protein [Geodermatophilus obscurus]SHN85147.1 hypothetical protein SAMN05660350_03715 [Geodermatophilus obscurus]
MTLLAAGAFWFWTQSEDPAPAATGTPAAVPTSSSALPPTASTATPPAATRPTEDDGAVEEEPGEDAADVSPTPTAAPEDEAADGLATVAVSLSYTGYDAAAAAVVAGGYAAGVLEEDATCTLVLRRDGVELRGESLGTVNVTTTDCGEVRVGGATLTSGTWEAVLSYTSDTSVGESAAGEVVVP